MDSPGTAISEARRLHAEAGELLHDSGLAAVLSRHGDVLLTGSYRLDLMAWPDLDIELAMRPDPLSVDAFFHLGAEVAALAGAVSLKFQNGLQFELWDGAPRGLYWGIRWRWPPTQTLWKLDLWAFSPRLIGEHREQMEQIEARLDGEKRAVILRTKRSLLTPEGRTPPLSGYHIYRAVLYEGMTDREAIVEYLRSRGVEV